MASQKSKIYRKKLNQYLAQSVIMTIFICCILAMVLVGVCVAIFFHQALSPLMIGVMCLSICIVAICMTGLVLLYQSQKMTLPITKASEAVIAISKGNFKARVPEMKFKRKGYPFENELDELIENVNKMGLELEGMDYMRKDFMSNVSHEVKTPVAAITGFSEILLEGDLSQEEQSDYLNFVHNESVRLSNLCENMLRLSRLDYQEIIVDKEVFRLDEQIRKCLIVLSEKWQEKNIEFEVNLDDVTVKTEKNLLRQVWMNLIDNAIKYSPSNGSVKIDLNLKADRIIVCIEDSGIGISSDKQERIFERFYQCEESHKKQGSGLGLSIVKRILELLEGEIVYESEIGQGTKVVVQLSRSIVNSF